MARYYWSKEKIGKNNNWQEKREKKRNNLLHKRVVYDNGESETTINLKDSFEREKNISNLSSFQSFERRKKRKTKINKKTKP